MTEVQAVAVQESVRLEQVILLFYDHLTILLPLKVRRKDMVHPSQGHQLQVMAHRLEDLYIMLYLKELRN